MPKDTAMTYFKHVTNHTRGKPDPTKYDRTLSWKTSNGNFGLGGKRKTFTDEAQARSKKIPAPTAYNPKFEPRILFGKVNKTEGVDYLSDCQYVGKCYPGPGSYKVDHKWTEETARASKINPDAKESKGWKPVKSKVPDCGSYDFFTAKDKIGKKTVSHFFIRPGEKHTTDKVTFTTEFTKMKKFVPGAGTYDAKIDKVARPYTRKRC